MLSVFEKEWERERERKREICIISQFEKFWYFTYCKFVV